MAVETRTVSYYTCDAESCDYDVYREVDHDGLPTGYHGTVTHIDEHGRARAVDYYACQWDHVPAAITGAMNERAESVEHNVVPEHHTVTGNIPSSSRPARQGNEPVEGDNTATVEQSGFSLGSSAT